MDGARNLGSETCCLRWVIITTRRLALRALFYVEEANDIYLTAMESYCYLNLYYTQGLSLALMCLKSEGSRKSKEDTLGLRGGEVLLFGEAENMFSEPEVNDDQVDEPDLAEPRNGDVFSHCHDPGTNESLAETFTKITDLLDLSSLEPE